MFVRQSRRLLTIGGAAALIAALVVLAVYTRNRAVAAEVPFSDLLRHLEQRDVREIVIGSEQWEFATAAGRARTVAPAGYLTANASLLTELAGQGVSISVRPVADPLGYVPVLFVLAGLGVLAFVLHRVGNGRALGLDYSPEAADRPLSTVTFSDVAGVDEAKEEVAELVDFLRAPERFAAIGGRIPKGVLLVGPPGTGKTLLARSIAGEAGVPFLLASGSDFVEMYAGVGAKRIRRLFRNARRHKACIVFIDELDAVGRSRGGHAISHEEREQTLNQLLVEMDGFAPNQGVVVIAATNRPDILDAALLRPGRFDRQVPVGAPDLKGREAILQIHARGITTDGTVDLQQIARGTPGFSGAELANLVNEAALTAVRRGRPSVSAADFDQARDKVLMGAERRSLVMSEHERVTCAYHESGHAVVAAMLPQADPLHKVTIIPRGRALGVTMQLPIADRHTQTREYLEAQLAILMGGRASEDIFLRQTTSGARNDIERATDIARRMVCELGMSDALGPLAYPMSSEPDGRRAGISEATAQRVDEEVRALILQACATAREIIERNRAAVCALADELLEVESVDAERVRSVIAGAFEPATTAA